ncbi:prolyl aminopeptidase [Salinivibrio sp. IB574]|uniref:prolyl aminopeptidase n=1 Tax=Salinivibrio sp. IB574 TaxID=1909444 RepID=UPI00098978DA|nr:prolyl aminopeptidase [Salinivibrio sp. IB574]OOF20912.1 prolyl aminopeptidase [Salinivibrio sp. IB574]
MTKRYPPIEPFNSGMLEVSDGHSIYWEEVGHPEGTPAIYLHGGPGSGCGPGARRNFDPEAYRAILFDQRGCGRSLPLMSEPDADLSTNTTDHLIADIEALREHLNIDNWVVVGGSWGVTLGLVYAQRYPERVRAMVLGAVTTGTRREIDWITRDMGRVFPREWERFCALVPEAKQSGDITAAYARLLADPDPKIREQAALEWCRWEDIHVSLMPDWKPDPRYREPEFSLIFSRAVTHYWSHDCFLKDGELMAGINRIGDIPAVLIHGRWDISGPLDIALALHRAWPKSELCILEEAGHGGIGFPEAMTAALDKFRK